MIGVRVAALAAALGLAACGGSSAEEWDGAKYCDALYACDEEVGQSSLPITKEQCAEQSQDGYDELSSEEQEKYRAVTANCGAKSGCDYMLCLCDTLELGGTLCDELRGNGGS